MQTQRQRGPVTRSAAGTSVGWMVAAATITILVTRLYLVLTGYPQVGGEIFHIAHAVWGGLLLMIGLFIALAIANAWAAPVAGILGGVGAGLFIDEIGKFITKDNDYFFRLAAPLAYGVLVAFAAAAYRAGRVTRDTRRSHLYAALELLKPALDGTMTKRQLEAAKHHVHKAKELGTDDALDPLIAGLEQTLDSAEQTAGGETTVVGRARATLRRWELRAFPVDRLRSWSRVALMLVAAIGLVAGPGVLALALWHLFGPDQLRGNNSLLGDSPGPVAWTAAAIAAIAGLAAGVCAVRAVRKLGRGSDDLGGGVHWGMVSLGVLLVGVNFTLAYFDQFTVLVEGSVQAGVFGMLARYGRRTGVQHR